MKSEVENKTQAAVSARDKILCAIGVLAAIACIADIICSISDSLPLLLTYGSSKTGVVVGGLLQLPVVFAALLLLSFSVGGFRGGLQGETAAVHFGRLRLAFLISLVCFALNLVNMFAARLIKRGLASEIAATAMNIFAEALFVLVPAIVVMIILVICAGGNKAGQKAGLAKVFLSQKVSIVCSLILVVGATFIFAQPGDKVHMDDVFTSFQATDLEGNPADQTIFADHDLTLVNVWATFMEASTEELPVLAELHEEYQDQGFQVVGICGDAADENTGELVENEAETARKIVKEAHADVYPNLIPAGDLMTEYIYVDIPSFPTSVFVDSKGNQVGDVVVGSLDKDEWKAEIEKRLEMITNGER